MKMKVKMSKILEQNERVEIPLYFCGNETDEFVQLDTESIYKELEQKLQELRD